MASAMLGYYASQLLKTKNDAANIAIAAAVGSMVNSALNNNKKE